MTIKSKMIHTDPEIEGVSKHSRHKSDFEHLVQFYETNEFLVNSLSSFIGTGLDAGDACIILATKVHREDLEARLKANGLDLAAAQVRGEYISLDAAETLAMLMVDGLPESSRFVEVVGSIVMRATQGRRHVRIFGELVALLYMDGNHAAAIRLEELWNDLHHTIHPFSLFCAYPMRDFAGEVHRVPFTEICKQHSQVIPDESYIALTSADERLRTIALLQQKANSLEAEIAERKAAEEALRANEERFRTLANQAPMMIWQSDTTGASTYVNTTWCQFTGLSEEESLRSGWTSAIHSEDRDNAITLWMQALATFAPYQTQFRLRRSDGVYRYVLAHGNACIAPDGAFTGYIGTILDITEQKELEIQRESFISMVTHELKTPLTALQGNVQLAQRWLTRLFSQMEQLSPEQQRLLEEVLTMLNRSQQQLRVQNRMINDLLDISRIQEDKLELRLTPCDLVGLVHETVQDYQAAHPSRLIILKLPAQDALQVSADRDRLRQVLSNYLTNALKFSPDSEPVEVGLSLEAANIRVWVQDHGPGLSPEQQEHVWKRFYQVPQIPVQRGSKVGLGLGLYICQQLISRQQGQVGIQSTPGRGATFWFTLPLLSPP